MKEPSLSRRNKPSTTTTTNAAAAKKLKLVCSFNGAFRPRPPSGKIRYVGGETRIISVDRDVGFSKLRSKISDLCEPSSRSFFSLNYHVRDSDPSSHDDVNTKPLVLIAADEDVRRMIEVCDKLDCYGKGSRLWIYACSDDSDYLTGMSCVKVLSESLLCDSGNGSVCDVFAKQDIGNLSSSAAACNMSAVGYSNEISARKVVLKQQLLAKQSGGVQGDMECKSGCKDRNRSPPPLIDLESKPQVPLKYQSTNGIFDDLYGLGGIMSAQLPRSENFSHFIPLPASHKQPLNPRDGNLHVETRDTSKECSLGQCGQVLGCGNVNNGGIISASQLSNQLYDSSGILMSKGSNAKQDLNRENIVPRDGECNSMKSRFTSLSNGNESIGSAIHNHSFGVTGTRNQRVCPYHGKNHQSNLNHGKVRDVRPSLGKYHPGLKPSTNISKQGQTMRLYHRNYWKAWSGSHAHTLEGALRLMNSSPSNRTSSLGLQFSMNCEVRKEACPLDMQEFVDNLDFPNNQGLSNGSKLECNQLLLDNEALNSASSHYNGTEKGGIASPLERSLHNLSLSSSKMETPPLSSITSSDVSDALLKPQSKPLSLMDEGQSGSVAHVELSNGFASNANSWNAAKLENFDVDKEDMNQDPSSGLSIDEKVNIKESHNASKMAGGKIVCDLAAYTHLATQELQTIKASDLEYIKELGSGTYGTVFYGKWKGSDVAIKKVKPSCFTDGSVEEDRLVADFWKEAHMLGQLHHPNIVALYGVVKGPPTNLATVTEYMVNGSLKQVLRKKDRTIDRRKRLIIAMDAAFGMEYLHEKNIVHFDLKSHNFLVNMRDPHRPVCKIGDLGLSKIRQRTLVSGGLRGTIPWMAPELLNYKNNMVTEKIDVYSFGIVMWELLTGEDPYANLRSEEIIAGKIKGDLRPEVPSWCDPAWRSLMERCWSSDPNSRPSFSEIAKELRIMATSMNIK